MLTKEQVDNFLYNFYANDRFRYDDALDGYEILDFKQDECTLRITYKFYSIKDSDFDENFILFKLGSSLTPNFPMGPTLCYLTEDFIFSSPDKLNALDIEDSYFENTSVDVQNVYWNDTSLPEDTVDIAFEKFDSYYIGEALVTIYGATKDKVPSFIPDRIKSRTKLCIDEYLNDN
jgi:hypothetical protein